ncbi:MULTISPECIES: TetR/AcrR family transcriptional regulator [unclassified Saccharothrix]|uniref:TetR/AcrR family transcriptional regulator n=1 Tax=unclassified Saccharothrix TaxID=2593673 RepID=UPI00307EE6E7
MVGSNAATGRVPWRERVRLTVTKDIVLAARRRVAVDGIEGLTIRAVSRDLGMSSPAMYRYFRSLEDLTDAIVLDVLDEMTSMLDAVVAQSAGEETARRIVLASRALRHWALDHAFEFQLTMVTPPTAEAAKPRLSDARYRFGKVFAGLFARFLGERGEPLPEDSAALLPETISEFRRRMELPVPDSTIALFLRCWVRLYGVICMEVMGQLQFLGDRAGELFEAELRSLADLLGMPERALAR